MYVWAAKPLDCRSRYWKAYVTLLLLYKVSACCAF